jgi:hypothetical protein
MRQTASDATTLATAAPTVLDFVGRRRRRRPLTGTGDLTIAFANDNGAGASVLRLVADEGATE